MRCSFALAALLTGCLQVGAFAQEEVIVDVRDLAAAAGPACQLETHVEGAPSGTILSASALEVRGAFQPVQRGYVYFDHNTLHTLSVRYRPT